MFAEKPLFPSSNSSNMHLPPVRKSLRRRLRPPPTPSFPTMAAKAAHIAENVSALKAKYTDYTTWLKASNRHNNEPVIAQELLKNSLCQMGIDSTKAEQLVSTCSWYVYQYQKDLEQKNHPIAIENRKQHQPYKNKSKKPTTIKDNIEDSTITISSIDKDESFSSNPLPSIRSHHHPVLPAIHVSDLSTSSRYRRVDFSNEQITHSNPPLLSSNRTRTLPKLPPLATELSSNNPSVDLDLSTSQRSLRRHGLVAGHTRSILRKQNSASSSVASTEISSQKFHSRLLSPISKNVDDIPLGTRSQRLFGGSECFAQIMNELEQQN